MYMRKVCYLDYLEGSVKVGNAGYVKLCLHDERLALEVRIRGLPLTADGRADIALLQRTNGQTDGQEEPGASCDERAGKVLRTASGQEESKVLRAADGQEEPKVLRAADGQAETEWQESESVIAAVEIRGGSGGFRGEFDAENVDGKGNGFLKFRGLWILLPGGGILRTDFGHEGEMGAVERKKSAVVKPEEAQKSFVSEWIPKTLDESLAVDKWEQLCRSYRQLHPFGDKTYISLTPKDFVIFRKEYQQLVNNSFLLHGFYNYRHLILGKEAVKEGEIYYLGVPGTYYDREKMVAVMFGFEGFEASGRAQRQPEDTDETTAPGTFGYYMRRVEI